MNFFNFLQTGGFPMDVNVLDQMQQAYRLFNSLGQLAGDLAVIKGCTSTGNTVNDGIVYINGELLEFRSGVVQENVIIIQDVQSKIFENGNNNEVYYTRYATFGTATTSYPWAGFKRVFPTTEIQDGLNLKADKTAVATLQNGLDLKADKTAVATVQNGLDLKADKTAVATVQNGLDLKADKTAVQTALDSKADETEVEGLWDKLSSKASSRTIGELTIRVIELEKKNAVFQASGGMVLWNKPANQIPAGWQEVVDFRGRMPVGFNPNTYLDYRDYPPIEEFDDPEFANWNDRNGGSKTHKLTENELPRISPINGSKIQRPTKFGSEGGLTMADFPGGGNFNAGEFIKPFGGDQPFSILNPYRVVLFIEYIG